MAARWTEILRETGGDFSQLRNPLASLQPFFESPAILFLDARACATLYEAGISSLAEAASIGCEKFRLVHYPPLDVYGSSATRVLQVITALQRGGAERITLDLLAHLPSHGCTVQLATLGRAPREPFPTPNGTIDCARLASDRKGALTILQEKAVAFGADVIHAHLLTGLEVQSLSSAGCPVLLTLHNTRAGWAPGVSELDKRDAALLVACSSTVEAEARAARLTIPVRTVRNGIDVQHFRLTASRIQAGREWRKRWGFGDDDLLLISVANPRPQKRLDLLPQVLATVQNILGPDRPARLVFCGEATPGNPLAEECVRRTQSEIQTLGLNAHVHWSGSVADTADLLCASDILVSTSAHEGLSLAHLEALAMGCSVVATDVGGAREIAWNNPDFHLVPATATPEECGRIVASVATKTASGRKASFEPKDWSAHSMAAQYNRLYPRAIARSRRQNRADGLWLITNNFSTGGAQSSARRLLLGLAAKGESVRAAVVEESPANPTPGRRMLDQAGIRVFAASPVATAVENAARLLTLIDNDPPRTVVFWNLRPSIKLLLAEGLLDVPVFDVSPGEMYFESLNQFFLRCPPNRFARTPRDYGSRLTGVIVKYHAEATRAESVLGAPVHVVPNGVALPPAPLHPRRRAAEVVFGTAARINPQKRLEDLLAAFRLVHNAFPASLLNIAGGIEHGCEAYAAELKTQAHNLPVIWQGEITDLASFHSKLDIFVMISDPAGCPNASLEAMAAGLPVIATDVGGASEQVLDGTTGRLVRSRDPLALSDAMITLARRPDLWPIQGQAGRNRIESHFSLERMIADYRRILLPL